MSDPTDAAKTALEAFKIIYPDLLQQSMSILGGDLAAVAEFLSLPFVRLRYASAEIKLRMGMRFLRVVKGLGLIDKTKRIAIPASIGYPAFDQLFIESDEEVSELYVRLLETAASSDTVGNAHPSFVACIKNMSGDEARILKVLVGEPPEVLFFQMQKQLSTGRMLDLEPLLTGLEKITEIKYPNNVGLYLENLTALGILTRHGAGLGEIRGWMERDQQLVDMYNPALESVRLNGYKGIKGPIHYERGYFKVTSYGRLFRRACLREPSDEE
jgi:hypothetical protein